MKSILVLMVCIFGAAAQAESITVDFAGLPSGPTEGLSVSSQGFSFSSEAVFIVDGGVENRALLYCPFCSVTMTSESGQPFGLQSFDFATVIGGAGTVTVTGFYGSGGTVSTSLTVDNTLDTYLFDPSWAGLDQLIIGTPVGASADYVSLLDNVTVNVVPIPGAVWLFCSALAGLGWMRRKHVRLASR